MGRGTQRYLIEDYLGRRARVYGGEKAILVGILPPGAAEEERETFEELRALAYTAGIFVVGQLLQRRARPDPATFIGRGKAEELRSLAEAFGADTALFNDELSPDQARTLEELTGLKIVDRTQLILDIFAQRAGTREAELAVELAQLEYLLPRLRGWGKALTNPGGGIGTMGPGETKMEIERRKVKRRIQAIRRALREADRVRELRRKRRLRSPIPKVAIVGYTNSGKSTLFRRLTGEEVLVEDKLFATLDTKVRKVALAEGRYVLVSDTVGFIRKLPHQLIPAFRATMEAAREADLLLNVLDASSPRLIEHFRAVERILAEEVFAPDEPRPPILHVLNKIDLVRDPRQEALLSELQLELERYVELSARLGWGLEGLKAAMAEILGDRWADVRALVPYDRGELLADLARLGKLEVVGGQDGGLLVHLVLPREELPRLRGVPGLVLMEA
ncbi:GTPase HflX [Candidatus Bipolaricaulota bacterium]|nr:GTPase HflX [Candidatus Bipolaricaulota bacterium]